MKTTVLSLILCTSLLGFTQAEVAPVEARALETTAWIGERLPFFIDLRSKGSFSGTASFDLPQIPGALVIKIGDPVVDTQKFEGEEWFVQKHEFALFSQTAGDLEIPSFSVRFSRRDGYSGPISEVTEQTTKLSLTIERPPGSENVGFLVTTESLSITETWDPAPSAAKVGSMFKRTITQRAEQLPGMALAPAPLVAPDGIRIYSGPVESKDNLYRGAFIGERSETITYLLQKSGTLELPALTYVWWNPKTQELESKKLPAVIFEVAAPIQTGSTKNTPITRSFWSWLLVGALILCLIAWQRRSIAAWGKKCYQKLNPPDRVTARELLRACRHHDATAAETAWNSWLNTQGAGFQPEQELRSAVLEMQRFLFYPSTEVSWQGDKLAHAFNKELAATKNHSLHEAESILPPLNPRPRKH